jgi:sulfate transport system permease protein
MPRPNAGPTSLALRGVTLSYLAVMVALPLVVLVIEATSQGLGAFRDKLTNAVAGTATAWVLVRYDFPGKGLMNSLVDLPIAVPTVVTGLMLVALYGPSSTLGTILGRYGLSVIYQAPGIVLALLFVTYPFVIRSVQPVLMELDRAEEEAAATLGAGAWTTFRRVTFPALWPSVLTGAALSFSRALGEFGSVVMVAGNQPLSAKTAPLYVFGELESGNRHGALAVSTVLLASSLLILVGLSAAQRRWGTRHGH